jgi:Fe2+ or Zn2+ uptake regulation protein
LTLLERQRCRDPAAHGIHPSAHRVAVAQYVLTTHDHASADRVWDRHHHLIDEETGQIHDIA